MDALTHENYRFYYHRLDIRLVATCDTHFEAWLGAVIRNNLLYAAEQVRVEETGQTLYEVVNTLPLQPSHPLYREMEGGFPKGYAICLLSHNDVTQPCQLIQQGEVLTFSLMLVGNISAYHTYFIRAIQLMCERGMGKPKQPFLPVDVCEISQQGHSQLLAAEASIMGNNLKYPYVLSGFRSFADNKTHEFKVNFKTPACLYKPRQKKDTTLSYQDKCNGFPSFYQLLRTAAFRLAKLNMLFCIPNDETTAQRILDALESYTEQATGPVLQSTNIRMVTLRSVYQKERGGMITLSGYIGEQEYLGKIGSYLPLLKLMEGLGIGSEAVYGLGRYEVEIKNEK